MFCLWWHHVLCRTTTRTYQLPQLVLELLELAELGLVGGVQGPHLLMGEEGTGGREGVILLGASFHLFLARSTLLLRQRRLLAKQSTNRQIPPSPLSVPPPTFLITMVCRQRWSTEERTDSRVRAARRTTRRPVAWIFSVSCCSRDGDGGGWLVI